MKYTPIAEISSRVAMKIIPHWLVTSPSQLTYDVVWKRLHAVFVDLLIDTIVCHKAVSSFSLASMAEFDVKLLSCRCVGLNTVSYTHLTLPTKRIV